MLEHFSVLPCVSVLNPLCVICIAFCGFFLASLLNVVIVKLRYDEDTEWSDDQDEPEEEALFFEMRKVNMFILAIRIYTNLIY